METEELAVEAATAFPADYSIAIEYHGPPVPFEIPCAIPIEIESIPLASVAAPASLPPNLHLPVIQPLPLPKKPDEALALDHIVASPTSVIENHSAIDGETSGEIPDAPLEPCVGGVDSSGPVEFSNDTALNESGLSSDFESSDFSDEDEGLAHQKRPMVVTFEPSGSASPAKESTQYDSEQKIKKGSCSRCFKGSRFSEKESCLVCDAKYCSACVLRAMGSMPEGRKCISCIGSSIEDSKRERLGKSSRMLKRLLSALEVEQIMKAEKFCEANQLRPEDVCVNGKQLSMEGDGHVAELSVPTCKVEAGILLEGHKPHNIISPNLNVGGGSLMKNASNGNTGIVINGREITSVERQMLKWAGVQIAGNPHFWVNADGTYQEEGQKNIKGQIWGKPGMKLICSFLSLPIPSKAINSSGKEAIKMLDRAVPDYFEQRALQKLLLVGYHGSGTSTIFKQAKFLYRTNPFSEDERENIKIMIQTNIYRYLGILLEGRERFEEESLAERRERKSICSSAGVQESAESDNVTEYSLGPRLKSFSDWLLKVMASGNLEAIFPAATRAYAPVVEDLWNDDAIQATYRRSSELELLPSVANYFLERIVDISRQEYEPSDLDILYADGITSSNGLASTDFIFPHSACDIDGADQEETRLRYQLIRVHTKNLGENCKWLDMFEDVRLVIFCVAASDYDEFFEDANGVTLNKMIESKRLFESIVTHPTFDQMEFLLILNKFDLLEQKIDTTPLTLCDWFSDFKPVLSRHQASRNQNHGATKAQMAFHFTAVKFKRLFASLTGRKLYVAPANGLVPYSVDAALKYAREILKWEEEKPELIEYSINSAYSTDPSFSP
ncbi:hypothetical protein J5N97_000960 [Dioscorea zingiberensis]|uniref:Uncharacterized protein n=1 Tax=Dioscorea zingiberensis TaxID=325984 RepID=A0A9D5BUJ1_9LILI|nr:hypothetical protein J5N97_000960 [Dioscorea zingiberensis]